MSQKIENNKLVVKNDLTDVRIFLPSKDIDVFPCSRRGRSEDNTIAYDPEARLNTERTNRISTAINGFTDSFVEHFSVEKYTDENTGKVIDPYTLIFVLAGYRVEARNFNPADIAEELGATDGNKIYAHLSLHDKVSLMAGGYFTEILYRQSTEENDANSLDVSDFFVGISFTNNPDCEDEIFDGDSNRTLVKYNLPIFTISKSDDNIYSCELIQTSLLPKIEHGETEDSIKISGAFTIEQIEKDGTKQTSFEINDGGVGTVNVPLHITKGTTIDGGVTLKAGVDAFSLIVGDVAGGEVFPKGTIKAKTRIETPTLDVKTIKNTATDSTGAVSIDDALTVSGNLSLNSDKAVNTDKLNVKNIKSRVENGTITVESPTELNSTLEVGGNSTLKSNLKIEGNINVGNPEKPVSTDNSGYIVAKKDITAEQDLVAKRDIKASEKATVKSLVVGKRDSSDSVAPGDITAKALVRTPTIEVNTITNPNSNIVVDKTLQLDKGLSVKETSTLATVTATKITANELLLEDTNKTSIGQVPALELAHLNATNTYQLRFKFGSSPITIKEE